MASGGEEMEDPTEDGKFPSLHPEDTTEGVPTKEKPNRRPKDHFYKKADSDTMIPISRDLLPALLRHCKVSSQYLMIAPLFGFHDDMLVYITKNHVETSVQCTYDQESKTIGWKELFCTLFETERRSPNTLLMEGDHGSGKTTFLENYALRHCMEFIECEKKGPESPCPGHSWKLILYIPAETIMVSQLCAIRDNLYCDNRDKDQVMTMIENDGDGVLVINDGIDQLRTEAEKESIRQYTIAHQKSGRPKILNAARYGLCSMESKYFDRKLTLQGFSIDQGIQYVKTDCQEYHSSLLKYIDQKKMKLAVVLTNPLFTHIFAYRVTTGQFTQEDIGSIPKLLRGLESFVLTGEMKRGADAARKYAHSFYMLCLEMLLRDERTITAEHIPERSPYRAFLRMHRARDLTAHWRTYFEVTHEMLFLFFSMKGLSEYMKSNPDNKEALLLSLCANPKYQDVLRLFCQYISEYEPQLQPDLVFIIQACLVLQVKEPQHAKSDITNRLLKLSEMIHESLPRILYESLDNEQDKMSKSITNEICAAFNENAELLKRDGWMLNTYSTKGKPSNHLNFITECLRHCSPSLQETICSRTTHRLIPCERSDGDWHDIIIPVTSTRWGTVQTSTHNHTSDVSVSVWSPSDISVALRHHYSQAHAATNQHDLRIDLGTPQSLWGVQPAEILTPNQWVPALQQLINHGVSNIHIFTGKTTPVDGLLSASQEVISQAYNLTGVFEVHGGQVSEGELLTFCEWSRTVTAKVKLKNITVVLGENQEEDYVKSLQQRIMNEVNSPRFLGPDGQAVNYAGYVSNDESDSEEQSSERPWELQALEPKYQAAYDKACKTATETVYQSRVMVVGHYGAGKTSLVHCLLDKDFVKEYKTTTGINADPTETKVSITKAEDWKPHQEVTYPSRVAKHVVAEVQKEKPISEGIKEMTQAESLPTHLADKPTKKEQHPTTKQDTSDVDKSEPIDAAFAHIPKQSGGEVKDDDDKNGTSASQTMKTPGIPRPILEGIRREEQRARQRKDLHQRKQRELFFGDFAGQGVFYATHQLFLTARSLYIIVMNIRQKLTDTIPTWRKNLAGKSIPDDSCPQTVKGYLEYWLSCIYTHIESSKRAAGNNNTNWEPQIIIVLTHKDEGSKNEVKEYADSIQTFLEEKGFGFLVKQVTAISNLERDPADVEQLKKTLERLVGDRGYPVPLSWYRLKEAIMMDGRKCISLNNIHQIAEEADLNEMDDTDLKAALSFFHETGDVVYFGDGPLDDIIVTDTQWLIDHFKKVVTIPEAHKNGGKAKLWADLDDKGILHQKLLDSLWPEDIKQHLLNMMLRFSLLMPAPDCYREYKIDDEDKIYLVPCLLPSEEHLQNQETDNIIRLCPNLGFLPVGLVGRLISSLCNGAWPKWEVCGPVHQDSARFRTGTGMEISVSIRKQMDENSNKLDIIEISVPKKAAEKEESKLKESLSTIAQSLQHLPGRNDFGVWLLCPTCQQWNFICDLNDIDDRHVPSRSICEKHGTMVKRSEQALWFCERKAKETDSKKHQSKSKDAQESSESSATGEDDLSGGKIQQDMTLILLLVSIKDINEEQLAKMGLPMDHWKAAVHIISEVRGSPRWRMKGFCRAFPLYIQNCIKQIHRLQRLSFTRRFNEEGGVLGHPDTDVVLTVPPGAVSPEETVDICVTIYTDLETYKEVIDDEMESIISPVVECEMDRKKRFRKAVTLSIPLCISPKSPSDITVMYSDGDRFQKKLRDTCKIKGNVVDVETRHFTEFVVKGKTVEIRNVLLTLGARLQKGSCNKLELRPLAHVNCLILKEFEEYRIKSYPKGMQEIDRELVSLPEREEPLQFPEVVTKVWLNKGSPWKIIDKDKDELPESFSLEKSKNGMDILNTESWATRPLPKFHLESDCSVKQAECDMSITFNYKEVEPAAHTFSVIYPELGPTASTASPEISPSRLPLWDKANTDQQKFVFKSPSYESLLRKNLGDLIYIVRLDGLWAHLIALSVIDQSGKDRILSIKDSTRDDHVRELVDYLERSQCWRLHGFLRALAKTDQKAVIEQILGLNAAVYMDQPPS